MYMSFVLSWKRVVMILSSPQCSLQHNIFLYGLNHSQGLYLPTHNKPNEMVWNEIAKLNKKKKNIVAASNLPPHFLLHLNAATDAFMLWWWNSYNAHTVQELRQTSRVLLNFNRKTLQHLKYPVIFTWGSVINKLWVSDPPNSSWKHRRGNQGAGP